MRVVRGDTTTFQALTWGVPSQETFNYLSQLGESFDRNISDTAKFRIGEVQQFYKTIGLDEALAALRAAQDGLDNISLPNRILTCNNLSELQHAPDAMIPWIMANPVVYEKYQHNEIEGYGDRFDDYFSDVLGDTRPLYQAAVHGLRREVGDGDWKMELFADVSCDESLQIDMRDQLAIMATWNEVEYQLSLNDRDPTSQFNGKL